MKILDVKSLSIHSIKVITFSRFSDERGYFSEHFRESDFNANTDIGSLQNVRFLQCNESFSKTNTIRGLHFQWNPFMGKLVRTIQGHMIDLVLDIRIGSPTYGQLIAFDMLSNPSDTYSTWIWVPPGFAHGNMFLQNTTIEYFCTGEYSPGCEAGISPFADDIDWSLCDQTHHATFDLLSNGTHLITDKDRDGLTLTEWTNDPRSKELLYSDLNNE
jgi:dTDP-4-dehydrorhamnose 3,5-epimerase